MEVGVLCLVGVLCWNDVEGFVGRYIYRGRRMCKCLLLLKRFMGL